MQRDQAGKHRSSKGQTCLLADWLDRTAQHAFFGAIGCRSASVTCEVCTLLCIPYGPGLIGMLRNSLMLLNSLQKSHLRRMMRTPQRRKRKIIGPMNLCAFSAMMEVC